VKIKQCMCSGEVRAPIDFDTLPLSRSYMYITLPPRGVTYIRSTAGRLVFLSCCDNPSLHALGKACCFTRRVRVGVGIYPFSRSAWRGNGMVHGVVLHMALELTITWSVVPSNVVAYISGPLPCFQA
jgi:hypothetical protein